MRIPPFSLEKQLYEIGDDLDLAVSKVLRSGQYIGGRQVDLFEKSFAEKLEVPHVIGCNSGTDALILALRAFGIGPGDEVITVSFSFFATAEAISNVGAKPVFVDVDPQNFLLDVSLLESAITSSTKAILPVHLFGCPVDMHAVMSVAKKHGLKVIEDCAQAAGAFFNGKPVGGLGDAGCFSFFPTKNLGAAGDGGAVATHDQQIAEKIRELAVHGMPKRYFHTELGYNSRLDSIQAAILNVKLPKLSDWIEKRTEISHRYNRLLRDIQEIDIPENSFNEGIVHSWNQFVIKVRDFDISSKCKNEVNKPYENSMANNLPDSSCRDWLKDELSKEGINTIIYYPIPIHLQPIYQKKDSRSLCLSVTEELSSQVLSLPIFPELTIEEQNYVVDIIKSLLSSS